MIANRELRGVSYDLSKIKINGGTNLLTKFNDDRKINGKMPRTYGGHDESSDRKINVTSRVKNAPPPGDHVFQPTGIIFKLVKDIKGMHLLTKFHSHLRKNAPPLGSFVFQANVTIFELIQDFIETNLLSKFHDDWTIDVASRGLTRQMLTPHNGQHTTDIGVHTSSP
ncbi:hypothetical protein DPMN_126072 [Dreissena polymorpha]|uniref:Uncharacterized protein n=1 Tax=Dreissena polymorpha TaxID=45954 RepID=A0A9D4JV98_DREPO|nr:hypothetical protein DPMN_126072 [Dreissena polymorpha]